MSDETFYFLWDQTTEYKLSFSCVALFCVLAFMQQSESLNGYLCMYAYTFNFFYCTFKRSNFQIIKQSNFQNLSKLITNTYICQHEK
jgi:hypothetical protein